MDEVRLQLTDRQVALLAAPTAVAWLLLLGVVARLGGRPALTVALLVVAPASLAALVVGLRRRRLVLTPSAAVLEGRRRRVVPWDQVTAVGTERRGLGHVVVLHTPGRSRPCPAPLGGLLVPDRHFDEKAAYVQRWWLACGGGGATEPGPVGGATGWGLPVLPGEVGDRPSA